MNVTEVARGRAGWPDIDAAAQIWAEATAARDGDDEPADLTVARPVIQAALDRSPAAFVLLARDQDGTPAGFAAVEPVAAEVAAAEPGAAELAARPDDKRAQVSYLGVRPGRWGRGVGESLMRAVRDRLAASGYAHAELLVYVDNPRATSLYARLGWRPCGSPTPHPRTGKPEQRYELDLESGRQQR